MERENWAGLQNEKSKGNPTAGATTFILTYGVHVHAERVEKATRLVETGKYAHAHIKAGK